MKDVFAKAGSDKRSQPAAKGKIFFILFEFLLALGRGNLSLLLESDRFQEQYEILTQVQKVLPS